MSDILKKILAVKRDEIAALKNRSGMAALRAQAAEQRAPRGFARALTKKVQQGDAAVIAEIKKASPSKGVIRADFDPAAHARDYAQNGAACLSVLTDTQFFQGRDADLITARAACALPVIRKDFLLDELQIIHARALGADCVLLIAAALARSQLADLHACAREFSLDVLIEIHDGTELEQVMSAPLQGPWLLGINNRNLRTFETRLETTLELLPHLPSSCEVVTESGIATPADVQRMRAAGVQRFLIGESLMRQARPGAALKQLLA